LVEEIRLHGMGGQGVVACGELIAIAALYEGKFCRAFPFYGSARRGAPVLAFAQIGDESEATRSMIYHPGYLLVLDPAIPESTDVTEGLKEGGTILYNTKDSFEEAASLFNSDFLKLGILDATGIAERMIGRPIPNTTMLGAFSKTTQIIKLESIEKAIMKRFEEKTAKTNINAAREGYNSVKIFNVKEGH
jgi:2-oxoacid:acceptor oxidoreductase gamma subunit (pyruvate/2-ketoisovalerate family)